ncbi:MAG: hypothetical protein OXE50_14400 [Chloroflexi bacterium]|nr:hypothetical protein [Chloroflexota bacterium]
MKRIVLFIALLAAPTFAAAECSNEWSIEPNAKYDTQKDTATIGLDLVFTFGGDTITKCKAKMADIKSKEAKTRYEDAKRKHEDAKRREQELENEMDRLKLCLFAAENNAPRLIAECRAEGFIE